MKYILSKNKDREIKDKSIKTEFKMVNGFVLRYDLYHSSDGYITSYHIKTTKIVCGNIEEEAWVHNFEWRKKEAQNIFETIIRGEVTPHCLEDCVLELI